MLQKSQIISLYRRKRRNAVGALTGPRGAVQEDSAPGLPLSGEELGELDGQNDRLFQGLFGTGMGEALNMGDMDPKKKLSYRSGCMYPFLHPAPHRSFPKTNAVQQGKIRPKKAVTAPLWPPPAPQRRPTLRLASPSQWRYRGPLASWRPPRHRSPSWASVKLEGGDTLSGNECRAHEPFANELDVLWERGDKGSGSVPERSPCRPHPLGAPAGRSSRCIH